ncbi:MAG: alpha/beta hydrolase [Acidobacteriaceae bacterium]|jgi:pimeloyl-ACP methyl ester carboxylesterase|nr:alpha/beta hydrolase [Acidobacteriaceae bacterium]
MRSSHFTRPVLAVALTLLATLGRAAAAGAQPANFEVFVRGAMLGTEQVSVERTADGWTISSTGRIGPPVDTTLRTFRLRYDGNWRPRDLTLEVTMLGKDGSLQTTIDGSSAKNIIVATDGQRMEKTDVIDPQSVLLPDGPVAAYEAVAARLQHAKVGDSLPVYLPPAGSFSLEVTESTSETIETVSRRIAVQRTHVLVHVPNLPPQTVEFWGDDEGRLLRVTLPAQGIDFARDDIASVGTRVVTMARPNDESVFVPANGFSLAGTISKPTTGTGPFPAVVFVSSAGQTDRDEVQSGVAIFGQLATRLADAGWLVLRYDKRGVGKSGGRPEAAALAEYAEDAKAAVLFLSNRKDVDRRRIAVLGHDEGGWVALLAAANNNRVAAVALLSTSGTTGVDLNLYQLEHGLDRSNRPAEERAKTVALQKQIQQAVLTGKGWETMNLPKATRQQAETPYFESFLKFDPAKLMKDVDQPLFVLQGDLDRQIPATSASTWETLAKGRKKARPVTAVHVPGINHLLVPATTGEADEYATLPSHDISAAVSTALIDWLRTAGNTPSR